MIAPFAATGGVAYAIQARESRTNRRGASPWHGKGHSAPAVRFSRIAIVRPA